ncbi:MAG: glycine cleavage system protein GcvH [Alphaproteobacteria bacterium]|nr:glycine cleavage system protein GcvH [Alphaproteobacteria bacterium]MBM3733615.1 glycine cleavage system protein GcvH [Acidimicrobiia bacterium]
MTVRFTKDHEWIRVENGIGVVGITDYAQKQLGDIVFVEMPQVGAKVSKGAQAGVVESVKAASEVYAPAGGEVVEVNGALADNPAAVNSAAESGGWFYKIRLADAKDLDDAMDKAAYDAYVAGLH